MLFFRFQITNQSISFYFNLNFYSNDSKFPFLFFEYLKNSQLFAIFISSIPQTTLFEESVAKNDNWQIITSMGYKN